MVNSFGSLRDKDSWTVTSLGRKSGQVLSGSAALWVQTMGVRHNLRNGETVFSAVCLPFSGYSWHVSLPAMPSAYVRSMSSCHWTVRGQGWGKGPAPAKANSPREARGSGQRLLLLLWTLLSRGGGCWSLSQSDSCQSLSGLHVWGWWGRVEVGS